MKVVRVKLEMHHLDKRRESHAAVQLWWILNLSWPEKLKLCSHLTEFTHLYWVINLHPLVQKGPILGHREVSCAAYIAYIGLKPSLTSSFPRAFKFIGANSPLACLFYCFFFLPLLITTIMFIFPFNTYAVQCIFESAERICLTLWQGRLYFHERIKKKKTQTGLAFCFQTTTRFLITVSAPRKDDCVLKMNTVSSVSIRNWSSAVEKSEV